MKALENIKDAVKLALGGTVVANEEARKLVPGFGGRIAAALVWDGTDIVRIPEAMGKPSEGQMVGTARERLVELAGRVCYDSLGTGRKSPDYHANIIKINHGALHEHAAFTVEFEFGGSFKDSAIHQSNRFLACCTNRVGLWTEERYGTDSIRVRLTLNLRTAREWGALSRGTGVLVKRLIGYEVMKAAQKLAPVIVPSIPIGGSNNAIQEFGLVSEPRVVEPETDEEKWVTLYLTGSRGWSHELVRHGDWTAISQRSTRYVDESESDWVMHPLVAAYLREMGDPLPDGFIPSDIVVDGYLTSVFGAARKGYDKLVSILQPWLEAKGIDKFSARKQARGAARGLLGNALETEVIFSASVSQWRHMLNMRAADAADGEIRLGFAEAVLPCLQACRYGDRFQDFELAPAKDGIGRSLAGGGHK